MNKNSKIFIAGHTGLVGSAITRLLKREGFNNLLLVPRKSVDLLNQEAVNRLFEREKIEYCFVAAARVGGIHANRSYPAQFIYENLTIGTNLIQAAHRFGVQKLLYLGSSCIYPKNAPQPIKEEYLLTGPLEETNEAYAIAKIAGLKMCKHFFQEYGSRFIAAMPTNLYGPNDNFDEMSSHVMPALIRKFHMAKISGQKAVTLWGSGKPRREFLHVDDLAAGLLVLMEKYESPEFLNVGSGTDVEIRELAEKIASIVGFDGEINYDRSMPDGTPRKLLDISKIRRLGWSPQITLDQGIRSTYEWALKNGILRKAIEAGLDESRASLAA